MKPDPDSEMTGTSALAAAAAVDGEGERLAMVDEEGRPLRIYFAAQALTQEQGFDLLVQFSKCKSHSIQKDLPQAQLVILDPSLPAAPSLLSSLRPDQVALHRSWPEACLEARRVLLERDDWGGKRIRVEEEDDGEARGESEMSLTKVASSSSAGATSSPPDKPRTMYRPRMPTSTSMYGSASPVPASPLSPIAIARSPHNRSRSRSPTHRAPREAYPLRPPTPHSYAQHRRDWPAPHLHPHHPHHHPHHQAYYPPPHPHYGYGGEYPYYAHGYAEREREDRERRYWYERQQREREMGMGGEREGQGGRYPLWEAAKEEEARKQGGRREVEFDYTHPRAQEDVSLQHEISSRARYYAWAPPHHPHPHPHHPAASHPRQPPPGYHHPYLPPIDPEYGRRWAPPPPHGQEGYGRPRAGWDEDPMRADQSVWDLPRDRPGGPQMQIKLEESPSSLSPPPLPAPSHPHPPPIPPPALPQHQQSELKWTHWRPDQPDKAKKPHYKGGYPLASKAEKMVRPEFRTESGGVWTLDGEEEPGVPGERTGGVRQNQYSEAEDWFIVNFSNWLVKKSPRIGMLDIYSRVHQKLPHHTQQALYLRVNKSKDYFRALGLCEQAIARRTQRPRAGVEWMNSGMGDVDMADE